MDLYENPRRKKRKRQHSYKTHTNNVDLLDDNKY